MLSYRRAVPALRAGLALCALAALLLALAPSAGAAPITVQLRVEGSAKTLFEGPVATEPLAVPGISTASSEGAHPCDVKDNGSNEGFGSAGATPTGALYQAATAAGLAFDAKWSSPFKDFFVNQVGGDLETGAPNFEAWGYAVNFTTANVGGCQFQLAPGSQVLWAYNYFNLEHLLSASGPAVADVNAPVTIHVVDGRTGEPVPGAAIGEYAAGVTSPLGGVSTNGAGDATVTFAHAGQVQLKASAPNAVRSNAISICVHNGSDGTCGTSVPPAPCPLTAGAGGCPGPPVPPCKIVAPASGCFGPAIPPLDTATAGGVRKGRSYNRRNAPRVLTGTVKVPAGGTLRDVRITLLRRLGRHCYAFSGTRVRFIHARCGSAHFFSVGGSQSFSYLLPSRLPRGRYVYEVQALDSAGHASPLVPGVSEVSFRVA